MDIEKVVQNIQRICREKGTTPTAAGKESGAGKDLVSLMKMRGSFPSVEKMSLLAAYLGVTTSELLGEKIEPAPKDGGGLNEEQQELVSLYDAASPALRAAALAVLRSADGQVTEAGPDQAAAQPKMLETVELQGLGTFQLKEVEPWRLSGSAKRQDTGTATERAKPQKGPQVIAPDAKQTIMRRKDRMRILAKLLESAQSTKGPGSGHGQE